MSFKSLRQKKWFKIISNKYVLILLIFGFWMLFLDSNSWLIHRELNGQIEELNTNKQYYNSEIAKDKNTINNLHDSLQLESFARQQYYMKRPNEDIYIIEYDTINK